MFHILFDSRVCVCVCVRVCVCVCARARVCVVCTWTCNCFKLFTPYTDKITFTLIAKSME